MRLFKINDNFINLDMITDATVEEDEKEHVRKLKLYLFGDSFVFTGEKAEKLIAELERIAEENR